KETLMEQTAIATVGLLRAEVGSAIDLTAEVPDVLRAAVHYAARLRQTHSRELRALDQIVHNLRDADGRPRLDLRAYEETYPAGVPCWVDTNQPDPAGAARFYSGLFGWQTEDAMPPDAGTHYYMARIGGRDAAAISSQPPGAPPQAMWNTYIRVESADDAAARVREAGGRVLSEPFDVFDAGRMGVFADPEGAVFCVWQPGSHRGSAAVNEQGAV